MAGSVFKQEMFLTDRETEKMSSNPAEMDIKDSERGKLTAKQKSAIKNQFLFWKNPLKFFIEGLVKTTKRFMK